MARLFIRLMGDREHWNEAFHRVQGVFYYHSWDTDKSTNREKTKTWKSIKYIVVMPCKF